MAEEEISISFTSTTEITPPQPPEKKIQLELNDDDENHLIEEEIPTSLLLSPSSASSSNTGPISFDISLENRMSQKSSQNEIDSFQVDIFGQPVPGSSAWIPLDTPHTKTYDLTSGNEDDSISLVLQPVVTGYQEIPKKEDTVVLKPVVTGNQEIPKKEDPWHHIIERKLTLEKNRTLKNDENNNKTMESANHKNNNEIKIESDPIVIGSGEEDMELSGPFSINSVLPSSDQSYDITYKVIILGESDVGKTNLLGRWSRNHYVTPTPTLSITLVEKSFIVSDKIIRIVVWDIAGQESFRSLTPSYYRGTHGAILVFDLSNANSFSQVEKWLGVLREQSENPQVILIGNKNDLPHRQISKEQALSFAHKNSISYMETSAKSGTNVNRAFQMLLTDIHKVNISLVDDGGYKNGSSPVSFGEEKYFPKWTHLLATQLLDQSTIQQYEIIRERYYQLSEIEKHQVEAKVWELAKIQDPRIEGDQWGKYNALNDLYRLACALHRLGFLGENHLYSFNCLPFKIGEGSQYFSLGEKLGRDPMTGQIGYVNGMGHHYHHDTLSKSGRDAALFSELYTDGNNIHCVFHSTHQPKDSGDLSGFMDVMRMKAIEGGCYTKTTYLIVQQWIDYFNENPMKNFLQIAHSEGALLVHSSIRLLNEARPDLLNRLRVIAFCPSYFILPENYPIGLQVMNLVKKEDKVINPWAKYVHNNIEKSDNIKLVVHTSDDPHNHLTGDYVRVGKPLIYQFMTTGNIL